MPYRRTIAEEYDYDCLFCRINYPTPGGEYLGSTENNCKGCLALIEQAEELLRPLPPPGGAMQFSDYSKEMPNRIAITFINLSRPLEALNFCLSSLDVSSEACITHPSYDRRAALKGLSPGPTSTTGVNSPDLTRYNKSDFDPSLPPPTRFQTRGPSYILYTFALAGYKVYGPSNFSTHCLRRAYHSNPCLYELLARKDPPVEPRGLDLAFQYLHFERLWKTKEMLEWLSVSREEMEKRICDGVECGKVEETVGAWEMCSGCEKRWYCSAECREWDWLTGGHKGLCQDEQSFRKSLNYL